MIKYYKDHNGLHLKIFDFKFSLLIKDQNGWGGSAKEYKIRLLNERKDFPKSYWVSVGKSKHSKVISINKNKKAL